MYRCMINKTDHISPTYLRYKPCRKEPKKEKKKKKRKNKGLDRRNPKNLTQCDGDHIMNDPPPRGCTVLNMYEYT